MFADLGHFTQLSIQVKIILFVKCVLLLAYPETCICSLAADCVHIRCLSVVNTCIHGSSCLSV